MSAIPIDELNGFRKAVHDLKARIRTVGYIPLGLGPDDLDTAIAALESINEDRSFYLDTMEKALRSNDDSMYYEARNRCYKAQNDFNNLMQELTEMRERTAPHFNY